MIISQIFEDQHILLNISQKASKEFQLNLKFSIDLFSIFKSNWKTYLGAIRSIKPIELKQFSTAGKIFVYISISVS